MNALINKNYSSWVYREKIVNRDIIYVMFSIGGNTMNLFEKI